MASEPTPTHHHPLLTPRSKPKRQVNNIIEGPPFEMSKLISVLRLLWRGWNSHTPTLPKLHFLSDSPSLLHGNRLNLVLNRRTMEQGTEGMLILKNVTHRVWSSTWTSRGKASSESRGWDQANALLLRLWMVFQENLQCSCNVQCSYCSKAFLDVQHFHKNVHQLNLCTVRPGSVAHFLRGEVS